jgi:hypothetical protein
VLRRVNAFLKANAVMLPSEKQDPTFLYEGAGLFREAAAAICLFLQGS